MTDVENTGQSYEHVWDAAVGKVCPDGTIQLVWSATAPQGRNGRAFSRQQVSAADTCAHDPGSRVSTCTVTETCEASACACLPNPQVREYQEAIKSTAGNGVLVHWGGVEGKLIASLPYLSDVHVIDGLSVCRFALGANGSGQFDLPAGLKFSLGMDVLATIFGFKFTHTARARTRLTRSASCLRLCASSQRITAPPGSCETCLSEHTPPGPAVAAHVHI